MGIISYVLFRLRYTVLSPRIGQHRFFNYRLGRGLRLAQTIQGSHFYPTKQGWCHFLIAAASLRIQGKKCA